MDDRAARVAEHADTVASVFLAAEFLLHGTAMLARPRPHSPGPNGKVERFNRPLGAEWA